MSFQQTLVNIGWNATRPRTGDKLNPLWFFILGMGEDVLSATYVSLVDVGNGIGAGIVAMGITFLAVFALGKILIEPKFLSMRLWLFACGNLCGTWLVVDIFR